MKKNSLKSPKQKMEFSKKWLIISMITATLIVIASFICVINSSRWGIADTSFMTTICTAAFGQVSVCSLFYFRKAQAENIIKLSKQIQDENIDVQNVETANQIMNSNFNGSI